MSNTILPALPKAKAGPGVGSLHSSVCKTIRYQLVIATAMKLLSRNSCNLVLSKNTVLSGNFDSLILILELRLFELRNLP